MEKEGFIRCVDTISKHHDVRMISTDRHNQIKKLMRSDKYKDIIHQFDPWHVAKSILKKLIKASKKKGKSLAYFVKVPYFFQ